MRRQGNGMCAGFAGLIVTSCVGIGLAVVSPTEVSAATRTVTFGWEDGTSTILGADFFPGETETDGTSYFSNSDESTAIMTPSNVTLGGDVDYGPSDAPFLEPVPYEVTPFSGDRMLEIRIDMVDESDSTNVPIFGAVINLDPGDTVSYKFRGFDPTDGRSPSTLTGGNYVRDSDGNDGTIDSIDDILTPAGGIRNFAGFWPPPFQNFIPDSGWLLATHDNDPEGGGAFPNDGDVVFNPDTDADPLDLTRDSVVLRSTLFRPSLSTEGSGGLGSQTFYIDELEVSVTSTNPDAAIILPDGSVNLVDGPVIGDMNGDDEVNFGDLTPFTLGLTDIPAYNAAFPELVDTRVERGDVNQDMSFDFGDLSPFANLLTMSGSSNGTAVPEPTSVALLILGSFAFLGSRRRS